MKHKNSDIITYMIISVVGIVLIGLIVYTVIGYFNSLKKDTDKIISNTEDTVTDYIDYEITKYDDEDVRGDLLRSKIRELLGDYGSTETAPVYIKVTTVISGNTYVNTYTNDTHLSDIKNFSSTQYFIKPTAMFHATVVESANEAVLGIEFVQK